MIQTILNIVTQPLYQQWSSTSRTTVVFLSCITLKFYASIILTRGRMGTPHVFLRWNPNNVPTTCKPTIKGLASRYVHWSFVKKPKIDGFEKNQKREIEGGTVSLYYTVFWLFTRLLTLCRSLVFGLHIFLLNNFLRRVWNM